MTSALKHMALIIIVALMSACTTNYAAPARYAEVKDQVDLGMTRYEFEQVMAPVNSGTLAHQKRTDETFTDNGRVFDIVYVRTGRIPDGIETDEEYTPYVFQDGVLVAFGWRAIGGMKFTKADLMKTEAASDKTNVNVNTNVNTGNSNPYFKPYCPPGSKGKVYGCN
tara:strand:+ start:1174 stop:1674 length:501 start_codon:yes stop_codon:yes gene_type:complete